MKHQKIKVAIIILALGLMPISLCYCSNMQKIESEIYTMNTIVKLSFYGGDGTALVNKEMNRIEQLLSVTKSGSDISRINFSNGRQTEVNKDTVTVLRHAMEVFSDSHGCFDPSIYKMVRLWGFTTDKYRVPRDEEIKSNLPFVDFSKVKVSDNSVSVPLGVQLDLGGIGKGYAGARCREVLLANGIKSAVLSIGGNVQTVGLKPDGSLWTVAVKDPDGGENLCRVKIGECAVVTSGGYERYFDFEGKRYHHIIDPKTGRPAQSEFKSVTVICADGTRADALSTAFYIGGKKLLCEYLRQHVGVNVILYTSDNELIVTREIGSSIEVCGNSKKLNYIN